MTTTVSIASCASAGVATAAKAKTLTEHANPVLNFMATSSPFFTPEVSELPFGLPNVDFLTTPRRDRQLMSNTIPFLNWAALSSGMFAQLSGDLSLEIARVLD